MNPPDGPPNSAPLVAAAHLLTADTDITHQAKAALWPRGSATSLAFREGRWEGGLLGLGRGPGSVRRGSGPVGGSWD